MTDGHKLTLSRKGRHSMFYPMCVCKDDEKVQQTNKAHDGTEMLYWTENCVLQKK